MKKNKIAVILSGCGYLDGSEIHEAVLTLLEINRAGYEYECLSLNQNQADVVNHHNTSAQATSRNVLEESARIARGEVKEISKAQVEDYDALVIPGGYGVAKNLSNYANSGQAMTANTEVINFARSMNEAGKPIGLMCISPVIAPKIFGPNVECTIGTDPQVANHIEAWGGKHVNATAEDIVVDTSKRLVTTPAYMSGESIAKISVGIGKLVKEVVAMI